MTAQPRRGLLVTFPAALLQEIAANDTATVPQLARRLKVSTKSISRYLAVLERAGILTRSRKGNRNQYEIHGSAPADVLLPGLTVEEFLGRLRGD